MRRPLTIGEPQDKYEQEADRVAAEVVQRLNQPAPEVKPEEDEAAAVQRQVVPSLQRQTLPITEPEPGAVQRQAGVVSGAATPEFEQGLKAARTGGQPLDSGFRERVEPLMGQDFSAVRVHTDGAADQLSRSIQAKAFTTGSDVFFRQGEYSPGTRGGQELLAHELTHVGQQSGEGVQPSWDGAAGEGTVGQVGQMLGVSQHEDAMNAEASLSADNQPLLKPPPKISATGQEEVIQRMTIGIGTFNLNHLTFKDNGLSNTSGSQERQKKYSDLPKEEAKIQMIADAFIDNPWLDFLVLQEYNQLEDREENHAQRINTAIARTGAKSEVTIKPGPLLKSQQGSYYEYYPIVIRKGKADPSKIEIEYISANGEKGEVFEETAGTEKQLPFVRSTAQKKTNEKVNLYRPIVVYKVKVKTAETMAPDEYQRGADEPEGALTPLPEAKEGKKDATLLGSPLQSSSSPKVDESEMEADQDQEYSASVTSTPPPPPQEEEVHIAVVHTTPKGAIDDRSEEYKQVKQVLKRAETGTKASNEKWIIAGDFYLPPEAPVQKTTSKAKNLWGTHEPHLFSYHFPEKEIFESEKAKEITPQTSDSSSQILPNDEDEQIGQDREEVTQERRTTLGDKSPVRKRAEDALRKIEEYYENLVLLSGLSGTNWAFPSQQIENHIGIRTADFFIVSKTFTHHISGLARGTGEETNRGGIMLLDQSHATIRERAKTSDHIMVYALLATASDLEGAKAVNKQIEANIPTQEEVNEKGVKLDQTEGMQTVKSATQRERDLDDNDLKTTRMYTNDPEDLVDRIWRDKVKPGLIEQIGKEDFDEATAKALYMEHVRVLTGVTNKSIEFDERKLKEIQVKAGLVAEAKNSMGLERRVERRTEMVWKELLKLKPTMPKAKPSLSETQIMEEHAVTVQGQVPGASVIMTHLVNACYPEGKPPNLYDPKDIEKLAPVLPEVEMGEEIFGNQESRAKMVETTDKLGQSLSLTYKVLTASQVVNRMSKALKIDPEEGAKSIEARGSAVSGSRGWEQVVREDDLVEAICLSCENMKTNWGKAQLKQRLNAEKPPKKWNAIKEIMNQIKEGSGDKMEAVWLSRKLHGHLEIVNEEEPEPTEPDGREGDNPAKTTPDTNQEKKWVSEKLGRLYPTKDDPKGSGVGAKRTVAAMTRDRESSLKEAILLALGIKQKQKGENMISFKNVVQRGAEIVWKEVENKYRERYEKGEEAPRDLEEVVSEKTPLEWMDTLPGPKAGTSKQLTLKMVRELAADSRIVAAWFELQEPKKKRRKTEPQQAGDMKSAQGQ
ncbi:MAG: DUF4157 domain-containing protein [Cyanobacteria bacterium P01_G01_bin.54]